jgi:hypothetical protein
LLEVLLASAIAVLVLGALYVAVDVQVGHAQAGREVVEQAALSRTLTKRMSTDINSAIALSDPARWRMANQKGGSGGGMSGASGAGAAGAAPATAPTSDPSASATGAPTSGTSSFNGTTTSLAPNANTVGIPLGIQGDASQLNIYISRTPREALLNPNRPNATPAGNDGGNPGQGNGASNLPMNTSTTNGVPIPIVGDIRRITYWLVGGDGSSQGLARMEVKLPTSDDAANLLPPNIDNESSYIIAEEVRSLTFQYYDGTQWNDTWDSNTLGADGITPVGSPVAVAVSIGLARGQGPNAPVKVYRQVIAISTANGTTPQTTTTSTTTP